MKKNKLAILLTCCLFGLSIDPLESSCNPDFSFTTIGTHPFNLNTATIGQVYTDTTTLVAVPDTSVNIPGIGIITIPIDSIKILGVGNLATGLSFECVNAIRTFKKIVGKPMSGCIRFFGTPTVKPANDTISINYQLWVTVLGSPTSFNVSAKVKMVVQAANAVEDITGWNKVRAFPNPFTSDISLESDFRMQKATVELTNMVGQVVFSRANVDGNHFTISDPNLPKGTYLLYVKQNGMVSRARVQKL